MVPLRRGLWILLWLMSWGISQEFPSQEFQDNEKKSAEKIDNLGVIDRSRQSFLDGDINRVSVVSRPVLYRNGILFSFAKKDVTEVYLSGSFIGWRKVIKMLKNSYGIFVIFIDSVRFDEGKTYTYRYRIDSLWANDPSQTQLTNDGLGLAISCFQLKEKVDVDQNSPRMAGEGRFVFFIKDRNYDYVSWVGNKNMWDPFVSPMTKKGDEWVITLEVEPDRTFYQFYVDGKYVLDPTNKFTATNDGQRINYVPEDVIFDNLKSFSQADSGI